MNVHVFAIFAELAVFSSLYVVVNTRSDDRVVYLRDKHRTFGNGKQNVRTALHSSEFGDTKFEDFNHTKNVYKEHSDAYSIKYNKDNPNTKANVDIKLSRENKLGDLNNNSDFHNYMARQLLKHGRIKLYDSNNADRVLKLKLVDGILNISETLSNGTKITSVLKNVHQDNIISYLKTSISVVEIKKGNVKSNGRHHASARKNKNKEELKVLVNENVKETRNHKKPVISRRKQLIANDDFKHKSRFEQPFAPPAGGGVFGMGVSHYGSDVMEGGKGYGRLFDTVKKGDVQSEEFKAEIKALPVDENADIQESPDSRIVEENFRQGKFGSDAEIRGKDNIDDLYDYFGEPRPSEKQRQIPAGGPARSFGSDRGMGPGGGTWSAGGLTQYNDQPSMGPQWNGGFEPDGVVAGSGVGMGRNGVGYEFQSPGNIQPNQGMWPGEGLGTSQPGIGIGRARESGQLTHLVPGNLLGPEAGMGIGVSMLPQRGGMPSGFRLPLNAPVGGMGSLTGVTEIPRRLGFPGNGLLPPGGWVRPPGDGLARQSGGFGQTGWMEAPKLGLRREGTVSNFSIEQGPQNEPETRKADDLKILEASESPSIVVSFGNVMDDSIYLDLATESFATSETPIEVTKDVISYVTDASTSPKTLGTSPKTLGTTPPELTTEAQKAIANASDSNYVTEEMHDLHEEIHHLDEEIHHLDEELHYKSVEIHNKSEEIHNISEERHNKSEEIHNISEEIHNKTDNYALHNISNITSPIPTAQKGILRMGFPDIGGDFQSKALMTTPSTPTLYTDMLAVDPKDNSTVTQINIFVTKMMETFSGYFTTFATLVTEYLTKKNVGVASELIQAFSKKFENMLSDSDWIETQFGKRLKTVLDDLKSKLLAADVFVILNYTRIANRCLNSRNETLSFDLNMLLSFIDSLYIPFEASKLAHVAELIHDYPNKFDAGYNAGYIMEEMLKEVVIHPIARLGTSLNKKLLVDALTAYSNKHYSNGGETLSRRYNATIANARRAGRPRKIISSAEIDTSATDKLKFKSNMGRKRNRYDTFKQHKSTTGVQKPLSYNKNKKEDLKYNRPKVYDKRLQHHRKSVYQYDRLDKHENKDVKNRKRGFSQGHDVAFYQNKQSRYNRERINNRKDSADIRTSHRNKRTEDKNVIYKKYTTIHSIISSQESTSEESQKGKSKRLFSKQRSMKRADVFAENINAKRKDNFRNNEEYRAFTENKTELTVWRNDDEEKDNYSTLKYKDINHIGKHKNNKSQDNQKLSLRQSIDVNIDRQPRHKIEPDITLEKTEQRKKQFNPIKQTRKGTTSELELEEELENTYSYSRNTKTNELNRIDSLFHNAALTYQTTSWAAQMHTSHKNSVSRVKESRNPIQAINNVIGGEIISLNITRPVPDQSTDESRYYPERRSRKRTRKQTYRQIRHPHYNYSKRKPIAMMFVANHSIEEKVHPTETVLPTETFLPLKYVHELDQHSKKEQEFGVTDTQATLDENIDIVRTTQKSFNNETDEKSLLKKLTQIENRLYYSLPSRRMNRENLPSLQVDNESEDSISSETNNSNIRKLFESSSYSDEENTLKLNLEDAMLHQQRVSNLRNHTDEEPVGKLKICQTVSNHNLDRTNKTLLIKKIFDYIENQDDVSKR